MGGVDVERVGGVVWQYGLLAGEATGGRGRVLSKYSVRVGDRVYRIQVRKYIENVGRVSCGGGLDSLFLW